MAAIAVTSNGYTFTYSGKGRVCVRTSAGIPYVITESTSGTTSKIEVYKGNSSSPASFATATQSHVPSTSNYPTSGYGGVSAAIDSTGKIHISWVEDNGSAPSLMYYIYDTVAGDDTGVAVDIVADLGDDITSIANCQSAISIDSNDVPHVVCTNYKANMGSSYYGVLYNNRIGGAWNAAMTEIEGAAAQKNCRQAAITIDLDNKPCIIYANESDNDCTVAIGDANDPTTFTLYDVETDLETTSGQNGCSIAVDSYGNHYIAYRKETDTFIYINKHRYSDIWTTWQTKQTNSNNGINPSIVVDETSIYVFYEEDTANDIVYDKYSGIWGSGTWLGESNLQVGTYNTVKDKWALYSNNDSVGVLKSGSVIDSFLQFSSAYTSSWTTMRGQSFTGNGQTIKAAAMYLRRGAADSGVVTVSFKIYNHTGIYGGGGYGTGAALATSESILVNNLPDVTTLANPTYLRFTGANQIVLGNGTYYVILAEYSADPSPGSYTAYSGDNTHSGNGCIYNGSTTGWSALSTDLYFVISSMEIRSSTELDYVFLDETASPDVWWNKLDVGTTTTTTTATPTTTTTTTSTSTTTTTTTRAPYIPRIIIF